MRASGLTRSGSDMASIRNKYSTSSRFVAIHPTNYRARWELGQSAPQNWYGDTGRLMASSTPVSSKVRRRCSVAIDSSPRWMSCAVALAGRSGACLGFGIAPRAELGAQTVGGPFGGECITLCSGMSRKGGERAFGSRLGKDRNPGESCRSIASARRARSDWLSAPIADSAPSRGLGPFSLSSVHFGKRPMATLCLSWGQRLTRP